MVLVAAGAAGYMIYSQGAAIAGQESAPIAVPGVEQKASDNQQVVGNDKDEHGCIASAGYTWCAAKNKCLRSWEEKCEADGDAAKNGLVYVNDKYGFQLTLASGWEKYKVVPLLGVYAVRVHFRGETHGGMLYIGTRPTLQNGTEISVEVNIFDFNEDLYNESLTVEFIDFIRGDEKFGSIRQLVEQIHRDKENVIERLKNG